MEGLVQKDARVVPGERPSGTIRPVQAGRKADDQEFGVSRAEGRDGPGVVAGVLCLDPIEMACEPGAVAAGGIERR